MSKKSFRDQKASLKIAGGNAGVMEFLRGKTAEVIGNRGGHNYGSIGTLFRIDGIGYTSGAYLSGGIPGGNTIYFDEFSLILEETVEDMKEAINELEKEKAKTDDKIEEYKSKIAFMEENAINTYDEDQFKIFQTLKALEETSTSNLDKAKAIAELIRG